VGRRRVKTVYWVEHPIAVELTVVLYHQNFAIDV
jgi:hypothetical protein